MKLKRLRHGRESKTSAEKKKKGKFRRL